MSSSNIAPAHYNLDEWPSFFSRGGDPVILNVTGGNMLMKFAALDLVRSNPRIAAIYRDITSPGAPTFDLTHLTYIPGGIARTAAMQVPKDMLMGGSGVMFDWDFIARREPPPPLPPGRGSVSSEPPAAPLSAKERWEKIIRTK